MPVKIAIQLIPNSIKNLKLHSQLPLITRQSVLLSRDVT
ncbi:hypothetical protein CES85_5002 [Ochrobactrum quorumnocens]|uniref:Uncharacterized protein n=1 Tax=Ochrobactrum quorumnocens TaxID=271865 RepID=A0A248UCE8_9HYPH|nr:hypothetical protein CES85_5002 [[Ochrobactrum] quorumnocens]